MGGAFRVLHVSDSHIGADLPVRGRPVSQRRGEDFVRSYWRVLDRARELDVDAVIHSGDLYDDPNPSQGAIAAATAPLLDLAARGISVILIAGNHERFALPRSLLLTHPNIHALHGPATIVLTRGGARLAISGFPCVRKVTDESFCEALRATRWEEHSADARILTVHQAFAGARCGPANYMFRAGDDVVTPAVVPGAFQYVAAGHIHRHQSLGRNLLAPPIVYAGSPDRISFAEIDEPKGCVLVELSPHAVQHRFIGHAVRPMRIVPIDVTGQDGATLTQHVLGSLAQVAEGALVQVRLTGQATRKSLAGIRLSERVRRQRPDLLASVAFQSIEWMPQRALAAGSGGCGGAFAALHAPPREILTCTAERAEFLPPRMCATYALYESSGRLLYVGKASDVRSRIRTHLRGSADALQFSRWTRAIGRIEVRPAGSELEALLVEADLIRRLRPPFNQQMRRWTRYCYLCDEGLEFGQLSISADPLPRRFAFGPLRSSYSAEMTLETLSLALGLARCPTGPLQQRRGLLGDSPAGRLCQRYFDAACAGPCAARIAESDYAARLAARAAILAGEDGPLIAAARAEADRYEQQAQSGELSDDQARRQSLLQSLVHVHDFAIEIGAARALLGRTFLLGNKRNALAATITAHGLDLRRAGDPPGCAICGSAKMMGDAAPLRDAPFVPKDIFDTLLTAVRWLKRESDAPSAKRMAQPPI